MLIVYFKNLNQFKKKFKIQGFEPSFLPSKYKNELKIEKQIA